MALFASPFGELLTPHLEKVAPAWGKNGMG